MSWYCKVNTFFQLFKGMFSHQYAGVKETFVMCCKVVIDQPWGWGRVFRKIMFSFYRQHSPSWSKMPISPSVLGFHHVSWKSQQSASSQGVGTCPVFENDMQMCSCWMWEASMNKALSFDLGENNPHQQWLKPTLGWDRNLLPSLCRIGWHYFMYLRRYLDLLT